ncbi:oxidoreductase, zinc-binding dehydrogenase family protein [Thraustotheca clavata]|uniref:Oxidoreductase, zinc-binding dehydrogenase family protein n=1 Tax=Thraustotheca clavata TaxID=74557 RepID=A0A1W0A8C9_9STRA|nr:oxidoreductase, zinc-binding dehydrogenase family protein [Thraustotheca clavata]
MTTIPTTARALMLVDRIKSFDQPDLASCFEVQQVDIPTLSADQVLIKVECSPINPSNLVQLQGHYDNFGKYPLPQATGGEGSGTVVAAGESEFAQSLVGKRVGSVAQPSGMWAEYVAVPAVSCIPLTDETTFEDGASCFVNPLTVVAFVETAIAKGVKAIVHNAGASALGKMLVRHAKDNGIDVIAVVRRQENVDTLKGVGAEYIVTTSDADWHEQLKEIASELNATIGFDPVAGPMTGAILSAMPPNSELFVYGELSGKGVSGVTTRDLTFLNKRVSGFWLTTYLRHRGAGIAEMVGKVAPALTTTFRTKIRVSYTLEEAAAALQDYSQNMSKDKVAFKPFQ